ncbi:MAG: hypothetical protein EZS28_020500, partial [Streblomastix strix]
EQARSRILRLCSSFNANVYPYPETPDEHRKNLEEIEQRLQTIDTISKTFDEIDISNEKAPEIALALEQECNDGYEIALIDAEHVESITISKTVPIQISGKNITAGKRMKFCGGLENEGEGKFAIIVESTSTGDITVQDIEMGEWIGGLIRSDGGNNVTLNNCLLNGGGTIIHNTAGLLQIASSEFIGDGINVPIESFVVVMKGSVSIVSSSFKKGSFKGESCGCIICCGTSTSCTIESCEFIDNNHKVNSAAVSVTTSTCTQLIIKGTASKRTIFSGLNVTNPISGQYVKTVSSKVSISYSDFIDTIFTDNGNAILIDEQQASEISLIWCNFTNIKSDSKSFVSTCIKSQLSSEYGFQFNAENCLFSDCRYSGINQELGCAITIQSELSERSAVRTIRFTECILTNNRGNGCCGAILVDVGSQCTINVIDSYFNENSGTEANDILIKSTNFENELNSTNFNSSYSDSLQPNIIINNNQQQSIINLNHFPGSIFVSNKAVSGTRDGSRSFPYQTIKDSINQLNYKSKPVNMPRTIYIFDEIWDEYLSNTQFANPFTIKSGLSDDSNGIRRKPIFTTTANINTNIKYTNGDLTVESFQFKFSNVNGAIRPTQQTFHVSRVGSSPNSSLTIISCIFYGLGVEGVKFNLFIYVYNMNKLNIKDTIFQDAQVKVAVVQMNGTIAY